MHSTQNERINQITFSTLIIGVDIAKFRHVARAQDFRGVEFGKALTFENNREGFELFMSWFRKIATEQGFKDAIVGMEPTGHYWLNLAHFLKEEQVKYGVVNPLHVKKSKELDDNSPTKNDIKDAKVIAQLVKDGRYAVPSLLIFQYFRTWKTFSMAILIQALIFAFIGEPFSVWAGTITYYGWTYAYSFLYYIFTSTLTRAFVNYWTPKK